MTRASLLYGQSNRCRMHQSLLSYAARNRYALCKDRRQPVHGPCAAFGENWLLLLHRRKSASRLNSASGESRTYSDRSSLGIRSRRLSSCTSPVVARPDRRILSGPCLGGRKVVELGNCCRQGSASARSSQRGWMRTTFRAERNLIKLVTTLSLLAGGRSGYSRDVDAVGLCPPTGSAPRKRVAATHCDPDNYIRSS
jgi:hypothetical protein